MAELIFSIRNIFSTEGDEDCLIQYGAEKYYIPAYQRGYKWSSDDNGAVKKLLDDLWERYQASKNNLNKEYYLQYITIKKAKDSNYLEVIDGQQRLTTLSIFISVFASRLNVGNISAGRLEYEIRSNFFDSHIYPSNKLTQLLKKEWDRNYGLVINEDEKYNFQDIYYIFSAAKKINDFLNRRPSELIIEFYSYVLNNVKVIVNAVESHVESEKVFSNLNSNKVPLTETELIKGLLLTCLSRGVDGNDRKRHFHEILEMRTALGRQWDEISRWCNQSKIKSFYFQNKDGMESFLRLVALSFEKEGNKINRKENTKHYPLFDFFHRNSDVRQVLQRIDDYYLVLNDWYNNDTIYNLLGYCRFAKGGEFNTLSFLHECMSNTKSGLIRHLKDKRRYLLPNDVEDLFYGNDRDNDIHRVLLALSVFNEGQTIRFSFYEFIKYRWSLEHIFPQSPEGKKNLTPDEKDEILKLMGHPIAQEILDVLELDSRTPEQKELYYEALRTAGDLNSIGNMCLLTMENNSSNGCGLFKEKRINILRLIRESSFVPKHTFEVFSKVLFDESVDGLTMWTKSNIENHRKYIVAFIENIDSKS